MVMFAGYKVAGVPGAIVSMVGDLPAIRGR